MPLIMAQSSFNGGRFQMGTISLVMAVRHSSKSGKVEASEWTAKLKDGAVYGCVGLTCVPDAGPVFTLD